MIAPMQVFVSRQVARTAKIQSSATRTRCLGIRTGWGWSVGGAPKPPACRQKRLQPGRRRRRLSVACGWDAPA
jgi:hypothetical protein